MDFCEACGVCIDPQYMKPDWYGNKLICCPECAEAHGIKGDDEEMTLLEEVEGMVSTLQTIAKENEAISISFTSICGVEVHVTNKMFAQIQANCEIDSFLSGDYPFRAKKTYGGATWFTLIKGEKVEPFMEGCLTFAEQHRAAGAYLDSLVKGESHAA
ncbi:hypothetical protein [Anaerospora sp.]|uniref:hypothetical protein n=1 Tax=Anaerospora sp. TaxID=1960278 RepID=UPI0028A042D4|nr:hypothetical protein [Anaerospora sp.]